MTPTQNLPKPSAGADDPMNAGFHLMAKPVGPDCNLRCDYCFYREKKAFFPGHNPLRMSDAVLEAYTREYIRSQPGSSLVFEWQGGEPTLAGLVFFKKALAFQKKYNDGRPISNSLQTNGSLLDDEWCVFLSKNNFLVGLSLDGFEAVHDVFRKDAVGGQTFQKVFQSLLMLQKHGVDFNILAAVNRKSASYPLEVYRFFKEAGVRFIQFIPVVEREADARERKSGLYLAGPPPPDTRRSSTPVTHWSVEPEPYGDFLIRIFDEWVASDVGEVFVMNFEWALGAWAGARPGMCHVASRCGQNLILEHNGDVYSCDHFMYPACRLGNILENSLLEMAGSKQQLAFGEVKETGLPGYCRRCDVLFACRGGCPKHRFAVAPDGEPGMNYLCPAFARFFHHVRPSMERMLALIRRGRPVRTIMKTPSNIKEEKRV